MMGIDLAKMAVRPRDGCQLPGHGGLMKQCSIAPCVHGDRGVATKWPQVSVVHTTASKKKLLQGAYRHVRARGSPRVGGHDRWCRTMSSKGRFYGRKTWRLVEAALFGASNQVAFSSHNLPQTHLV